MEVLSSYNLRSGCVIPARHARLKAMAEAKLAKAKAKASSSHPQSKRQRSTNSSSTSSSYNLRSRSLSLSREAEGEGEGEPKPKERTKAKASSSLPQRKKRKRLIYSSSTKCTYNLRSRSPSLLSPNANAEAKPEGEGEQPAKSKAEGEQLAEAEGEGEQLAKSKGEGEQPAKSKAEGEGEQPAKSKAEGEEEQPAKAMPEGEGEGEQQPPKRKRKPRTKAMILEKNRRNRCYTYIPPPDYLKALRESEGFDVPYAIPNTISPISPMDPKLCDTDWKNLPRFSEDALRVYNYAFGTKFRLVRVVKANSQPVAGFNFFITFQAKEAKKAIATIFEAKVYQCVWDLRRNIPTQFTLVRIKGDRGKYVGPCMSFDYPREEEERLPDIEKKYLP